MPAPAANHQTLALIGASSNPDLDRSRQHHRPGDAQRRRRHRRQRLLRSTSRRTSACATRRCVDDCNWVLTTHAGRAGALRDPGRSGHQGDRRRQRRHDHRRSGGRSRPACRSGTAPRPAARCLQIDRRRRHAVRSRRRSRAARPASTTSIAYPVLDLGADGRITIILPTLDKTTMMTRVPKLTGPLAGAHYDMIASAHDDATKPHAGDAHLAARREPVGDRGGVQLAAAAHRDRDDRRARSRSRR